jgi:tetraacyldisaccharide 4'-kinase
MNRAGSIALAPISVLYGAGMKTRRALYRGGLLRARDLGVPVISVGNITTGGTGKTPLVEWIAAEINRRGRRVCIATRGYRRSNPADRVVVSDGQEILADVKRAGDEPLLLAERLKGRAAVICDSHRVAAARWAIERLQTEVVILDDGFQHLRVARDLDIVTVDATNPFGNGRLLPAGILREPIAELARADCVVMTRADLANDVAGLQKNIERVTHGRPVFRSRMKSIGLRPIHATDTYTKEQPVAVMCAVGNPEAFFAQLRGDGHNLCHTKAFRDHHPYTQNDVDQFLAAAHVRGAETIFTTAKDEVKLRSLRFDLPCFVVDVAIEIEIEERLQSLIDHALRIA